MDDVPPTGILEALRRMGLLAPGAVAGGERLTGGVSSDIWRIDLAGGPICVKRALAKLRVAADWHAPVERNRYEARWMQRANAAVPGAAPALLGQDEASAARWRCNSCRRDDHPLWKTQLRDGDADPAFAAQVADRPGAHPRRHRRRSRHRRRLPDRRDLLRHPAGALPGGDRRARIPTSRRDCTQLVATTQANKRALVHGDVSPKNILRGPDGPVFLDAECAWWGDPAFDLAFCLNHLLLKCLWTPTRRRRLPRLLRCAGRQPTCARVDWEPPAALEARAAHLLPGLLLARVDGKSPVEYITAEADRNRVRRTARALLAASGRPPRPMCAWPGRRR